MQGFLKNIYLRPSCYHCAARQGKSGADISIADYWGVRNYHKEMDDDKGVGLILVHTTNGNEYYNSISSSINQVKSDYNNAVLHNPCIVKSVAVPNLRAKFWELYETMGIDAIADICNKMKPGFVTRCINLAKRIIKRLLRTLGL